ncbi:CHAP domain-containing protein [Nonomuraea phyllanthi]|uniref:CHAP domain-containing protein n=1 Tax=Nonomuraea phyllanthi TaxID=2219224 RepID=A0A5C4VAC5_9ACTN|nr:CHAP domain-containing protein [Nonomuraea phyllanthi]KAB8187556.1 CHAP domain-containing protein [Nonomuraea phyllanthi]
MTPEMQKFIDLLESQLGYSERAGAYTKFGKWYGKHVEFDADYTSAPWCDMYLSWAAHKLGYEDWMGQFAWTVSHAKWFKEQGAWGHKPKPGAFVFYDWSGSNDIDRIDHVGVVTKVVGDTIFTIEGNIDGGLAKRKERDTSKVVGYGYPERIKARLDEEAAQVEREARKKAEERAAAPPGPGTDVGTLDLPGHESLSSLIPRSQIEEPAHAPSTGSSPAPSPKTATGTGTARDGKRQSGSHESRSEQTQQRQAVAEQPKKAKHAKPTTADTTAATAEPLLANADASTTGPLPAVPSPTLVGSALVAALALLAVAKTRRLRMAPAAAGSPAPRSNANRRRRRRTATTTAAMVRTSTTGDAPSRRRLPDTAPFTPTFTPDRPATRTGPLESVPAFEPFSAFETISGIRPHDPATTGPVEIVLDTGPLERFVDTGPFERIIIPGATSTFDAFAPATRGLGDVQAGDVPNSGVQGGGVPDIGVTYRGRRRRHDHPVEEFPSSDLPLRGRRHRRPAPTQQGIHIGGAQNIHVSGPQSVHAGAAQNAHTGGQDHPLTGRRHTTAFPPPPRREDDRELVGASAGARSQPPRATSGQTARSAPGQPGRPGPGHAATSRQGRRGRGRHRA